jgi:Xaa-Pro aminopeptidase
VRDKLPSSTTPFPPPNQAGESPGGKDLEHAASGFLARQERLRALLEARHIPLIIVTNLINIRYLTGFVGSAGTALFGPLQGLLWVDPRYTLQAREQAHGVEVVEEKIGGLRGAAKWLAKYSVREIAFEASHLTCANFELLRTQAGRTLALKPAGDVIEDLRVVKDRGEIEAIRSAGKVTAEVFSDVLSMIKPGVEERDLASEVDYRMRKKGAEGAAFETIVASGSRGAYPHARPSSKPLQESDLVILDFGAILRGYAADMTRTLFLGEPNRRVRSLYSSVLMAQRGAVKSVQDGIKAGDVDSVARSILAKRGLAGYFTHSTGHGVGLEIHERPRVARGENTRLRGGSVLTVEPGVYIEGLGGVRLEDTVLVGPDGPEILTPASLESWVLEVRS